MLAGTDLGACLQAEQPTFCVPQMGYEFWSDGIHDVLVDFSKRYPGLPLVVTESGIATDVGARRAEAIVRVLESIARARDEGVDVRGYYHWSLTDNFEWARGSSRTSGCTRSTTRATRARRPRARRVRRDRGRAQLITAQRRSTAAPAR